MKLIKNIIKLILGKSIIVPKPKSIKTNYLCNVCGTENATFNPLPMHYIDNHYMNEYVHGYAKPETINLVNYTCSKCDAADRDRLHALYFDEVRNGLGKKVIDVLDIAPYKPFSAFLNKFNNFRVRTADLFQKGVDDKVNIENMDIYDDEKFDAFICSHVLEHIDNDRAGMKELYRVLKKGGWGIVMVPILLKLENDYELEGLTTESERSKHYGHPDHRRCYSKKGFVSKLEDAGFKVLQLGIEYFGKETFEKLAITETSVLYVVQK